MGHFTSSCDVTEPSGAPDGAYRAGAAREEPREGAWGSSLLSPHLAVLGSFQWTM